MTEQQARTTANVVMAAGAVGAAFYIMRRPPLRRLAWRVARSWAKGPLLVWAIAEMRRAWVESEPHSPREPRISGVRRLPAAPVAGG